MPPNILQYWDSIASKRQLRVVPVHNDDGDNESNYHDSQSNTKLFISLPNPSKQVVQSDDDGRLLWKKILRNDASMRIVEVKQEIEAANSSKLLAALSSIIILNDESREIEWLNQFGGRLSNASLDLLEGLRQHAPDLKNMSTVADFNDNLFYHMQQERGLRHFDGLEPSNIEELEAVLEANECLGSFLTTKSSLPQPPHVDYPWDVLEEHEGDQSLKIGFFPLTEEGMFLQIWPTADPSQDRSIEIEGQILFIPHGKLLTIPASTIHGGGFRTTGNNDRSGNLRFHLYIATNQATLPAHQTN